MVTSPSNRTVSNVDGTEYGVLISNIHVDTGADTSLWCEKSLFKEAYTGGTVTIGFHKQKDVARYFLAMVNTKVDPVEIKNELVVSYSLSESALLGIHPYGWPRTD